MFVLIYVKQKTAVRLWHTFKLYICFSETDQNILLASKLKNESHYGNSNV